MNEKQILALRRLIRAEIAFAHLDWGASSLTRDHLKTIADLAAQELEHCFRPERVESNESVG